jgi:hypothetical protein
MQASLSHRPSRHATFSYSPAGDSLGNTFNLEFVGEVTEDWVITGVPSGSSPVYVAKNASDLPQPGAAATWSDVTPICWMASEIRDLHDTGAADKQHDDDETWRCVISYLPDPSKMPTEVHIGANRVMQVVTNDVNSGDAIVNGAGDPYNPPVQEARAVLRVKIVKRFLDDGSFGSDTIQNFADHQSSGDWAIPGLGTVPAGDVFCIGIEAPLLTKPIWHRQAEFHFEVDTTNIVNDEDVGFNQSLLNCGYQYIDSNGNKVIFADDHGVSHGGIGLLNEDGTKADPGSPNYKTWQTKPTADFRDLDLFASS